MKLSANRAIRKRSGLIEHRRRRVEPLVVIALAAALCCHLTRFERLRADDPVREQNNEGELRRLEKEHLDLSKAMVKQTGDAHQLLFGSLSLLNVSRENQRHQRDSSNLLRRLVSFNWPYRADESAREMLERLEAKVPGPLEDCLGHDPVQRWRANRDKYRELTKRRLPTDWQARREFWLQLVEAIIHLRQEDRSAGLWKEKIAADPENAELYRLTYLEHLRADWLEPADFDVLEPLLNPKQFDPAERLRRACLVASVTDRPDHIDETPRQTSAGKLVVKLLRDHRLDRAKSIAHLHTFRLYFQSVAKQNRMQVIRTLLQHQSPRTTTMLLATAGVPDAERQQWFLAKRTTLAVRDKPLADVLSHLSSQVQLPLWIDESLAEYKKFITLEATGSWLEVLEAVLSKTSMRVYFLEENVIWIGPPPDRPAAEALLNGALSRSAKFPGLLEMSECEFVNVTWRDAVDFITDLHELQLISLWDEDKTKDVVTLKLRYVPACLVLAKVAEQAKLEWDVVYGTVVVMPAGRWPEFRKTVQEHRRRTTELARLELDDSRLPAALRETTEVEFFDTSLIDALDFISDLHEIEVVFAGEKDGALPVSFVQSGTPVDWTLSLILAELGMSWSVDEGQVVVGKREWLADYRQRAARRGDRRQGYPKSAANRLRERIRFSLGSGDLDDLVRLLTELTGLRIKLAPEIQASGGRDVSLRVDDTLVDFALDLLTSRLGLDWIVNKAGEVILMAPAKTND